MGKNNKQKVPIQVQPENMVSYTKDQLMQNINNSKRRISQAKGEANDMISETVLREYSGVAQACSQLYDQLTIERTQKETLQKENAELKAKLGIKDEVVAPQETPKN